MRRWKGTLWLPLAALVVGALLMGCAAPQKTATPAKAKPEWWFHDTVNIDFVKQYAVMPQPKGVMIVDARPKRAKYDKGHIPTAVSIPARQFDKFKDRLPKDKKTLLIFYCGGPT